MKVAWRIILWLGNLLLVALFAIVAFAVVDWGRTIKDELADVDYHRAKEFGLDVPPDATHIYCIQEAGGLQCFDCSYRFTVAPERVSQAVDEILAQRGARMKTHLNTTRYESLPAETLLANDPKLQWWQPESVKQGIFVKADESWAPTVVADKVSGTVYVRVTD